jgi:plastocyanin
VRRTRVGVTVISLALVGAACGSASGGGGTSPTPTDCSASGTDLHLTAKNVAFQPTVLCAPHDQAFTISFDDQDAGTPHNVAIAKGADFGQAAFRGQVLSGPKTVDYQVPALAPGVYSFRCDIHPSQMKGTLVVSSKP